MIPICLLLVGLSLIISLPLTWRLIGLGRRWGQIDLPGAEAHKHHGHEIPSTGGIAIFLAVALPMAAILATVWLMPASAWAGWLSPMADHLEGLRRQTPMALAVLAGLLVMHVLGLIDDRRRLGPGIKLVVQLLTALVLAGFFDVRVLTMLGGWGAIGTAASLGVSVLWMLAIVNAMNFLDNMDGLAGGVGAIIAGLYLAATLISGQWFVAALAAMLLGALLGFLFFNLPPARIFMGDAGSLVLGLTLAVVSIRTTYIQVPSAMPGVLQPEAAPAGGPWYGLLMPLMVLAVPLYDLSSVTLIRLWQGRSPFRADQQHFSHRLVGRGLSKRSAVLVIWLCTLATGLSGVMVARLAWWQAILAAGQTLAVLTMLALLELGPGRRD